MSAYVYAHEHFYYPAVGQKVKVIDKNPKAKRKIMIGVVLPHPKKGPSEPYVTRFRSGFVAAKFRCDDGIEVWIPWTSDQNRVEYHIIEE